MFSGVEAKEISDLDQSLIAEGMPFEEVQLLCDVHASVFRGSIEKIHRQDQGRAELSPSCQCSYC